MPHCVIQNVADNFLLFIYGKKYNNGVNGAFGAAQNIKASSKNYKIVLRFPSGSEDLVNPPSTPYRSREPKIMSSIEHYRREGNGVVIVEYM